MPEKLLKFKRKFAWKMIASAGPDTASISIRTTEQNKSGWFPTNATTLILMPGDYRVGVRGGETKYMEWRKFTVVSKMNSSSFRQRAPVKLGSSNTKSTPSSATASGSAGAASGAGTSTNNNKITTPLNRKSLHR
ncbi:MAG: hypothetical protein E4H32_07540 [Nitrospirales bacterium]|nr:MAG: hypothetical protein E4H32_07540 [Nitrospirales bacterium]